MSASARVRSSRWPSAWAWPRSAASTPTCGTSPRRWAGDGGPGSEPRRSRRADSSSMPDTRRAGPVGTRRRRSCGAATSPADWRFVVVIPDADSGLSGHSEEGVFGALAPSVRISEEVCRITQLRLMPALVEHDIEEFGRALTAVDRKTGAVLLGCAGRHLQRRGDQRGRRCPAERRGLRGGTELLGAGGLRPRARDGMWAGSRRRSGIPGGRWQRSAGLREPGPQHGGESGSAEGRAMRSGRDPEAARPAHVRRHDPGATLPTTRWFSVSVVSAAPAPGRSSLRGEDQALEQESFGAVDQSAASRRGARA